MEGIVCVSLCVNLSVTRELECKESEKEGERENERGRTKKSEGEIEKPKSDRDYVYVSEGRKTVVDSLKNERIQHVLELPIRYGTLRNCGLINNATYF